MAEFSERNKDELLHIQRDMDKLMLNRPAFYTKDEEFMKIKKAVDRLVFDVFVSQR